MAPTNADRETFLSPPLDEAVLDNYMASDGTSDKDKTNKPPASSNKLFTSNKWFSSPTSSNQRHADTNKAKPLNRQRSEGFNLKVFNSSVAGNKLSDLAINSSVSERLSIIADKLMAVSSMSDSDRKEVMNLQLLADVLAGTLSLEEYDDMTD